MSSHEEPDGDEGDIGEVRVALDPRDIKESAMRRIFTEMVRREAMRKKQASKRPPEMQKEMEEEADEESSKLAKLHEDGKGKSNKIPVTDEDLSDEAAEEVKKKSKKEYA